MGYLIWAVLIVEYWWAFLIVIALVIVLACVRSKRARRRAIAEAQRLAQMRYIGNNNTHVFHRTDCRMLRGLPHEQLVPFESCSAAQACGYKACQICDPWDVHPRFDKD